MTTSIISKLAPKNNGAFPTHEDIHCEGGFQVRNDVTDRNSIPTANRKEGMWVKLISDGYVYELGSGLTNGDWTEVVFGSGSGVTPGVILDGVTDPVNIIGNRLVGQSPITNTQIGIVNLSNDSISSTTGANANYCAILGGDQNQIDAGADGAIIGGGTGNVINSGGSSSTISGGTDNNVTGSNSTIGGGAGNISSNTGSVVAGGLSNQANNDHSTVGGGFNNVINGDDSAISGGNGNSISNSNSTICGGNDNTISVVSSTICGGSNNDIISDNSIILGGSFNQANGKSSIVCGYNSLSDKSGQFVHSCGNNDNQNYQGGSQYTRVVYFCESVSGATVNFTEGITNGTYTLENNRNYALNITVVAAQTAGVAAEMKKFEILISVDGAGSPTVLPASPPTPTSTVGGTTYVVDYTAGTNVFNLNFTGAGGFTVRATATIEATEILFA